jgi:hypothetical protein
MSKPRWYHTKEANSVLYILICHGMSRMNQISEWKRHLRSSALHLSSLFFFEEDTIRFIQRTRETSQEDRCCCCLRTQNQSEAINQKQSSLYIHHITLTTMSTTQQIHNYIGGKYVPPSSGTYMGVLDPATGKEIAQVAVSNAADVDAAIATAQAAYPQWSRMTMKARATIMLKFHALVRDHAHELAELIVLENGKNITEALADVAKGRVRCRKWRRVKYCKYRPKSRVGIRVIHWGWLPVLCLLIFLLWCPWYVCICLLCFFLG